MDGQAALQVPKSKSFVCSRCVSNGEGVPVLSLGNRQPGLQALSLERRQMVTRLNSAFHFNIGNVFNSPLFMSLKKGKWRKRPTGNLLTKAQAAPKRRLFSFQVFFQPSSSRSEGGGPCFYTRTCHPVPELPSSTTGEALHLTDETVPHPQKTQLQTLSGCI